MINTVQHINPFHSSQQYLNDVNIFEFTQQYQKKFRITSKVLLIASYAPKSTQMINTVQHINPFHSSQQYLNDVNNFFEFTQQYQKTLESFHKGLSNASSTPTSTQMINTVQQATY
ncbi:hypothetical protein CEXT_115201 [Caerostris extrusa]|uniref:Uncharacterized protein n=1 Tax=Caerostris extrusa TaxID=172846 RepID=A0AAV4Y431_CAEEX|nr:hypothetical protein CEXT_115201 [Caerostris extrusa]